jgi:putative (di)nucleoside polyphosphate hydrolase
VLSPWVTLLTRTVLKPGSEPQIFHSLGLDDYVSVLAISPDGSIPMVRQYRPAVQRMTIELPGGLNDSYEATAKVAVRELYEETSINSVSFSATTVCWYTYDLPQELVEHLWNQKYVGQRQRWFAFRFMGADTEINLETKHPEFSTWRWAAPEELPGLAAPFKRELYQQLISDFRDVFSV